MSKDDPFWEDELRGREKFKDLFLDNTIGIAYGVEKLPYDGMLVSKQHNSYIFELKYRPKVSLSTYSDFVLECAKAKSLLDTYEKNKQLSGAWYVNILKDTLLIWDITKIDLGEPQDDKMPKTSAVKSEKVQKPCYHLKPEDTIWMQKI
jgi:hypothetical protein